jgi:hypothetical protein
MPVDERPSELFSKLFPEVVGARPNDNLPCALCGDYGGIIIVEARDRTYDVCYRCAASVGIKW